MNNVKIERPPLFDQIYATKEQGAIMNDAIESFYLANIPTTVDDTFASLEPRYPFLTRGRVSNVLALLRRGGVGPTKEQELMMNDTIRSFYLANAPTSVDEVFAAVKPQCPFLTKHRVAAMISLLKKQAKVRPLFEQIRVTKEQAKVLDDVVESFFLANILTTNNKVFAALKPQYPFLTMYRVDKVLSLTRKRIRDTYLK